MKVKFWETFSHDDRILFEQNCREVRKPGILEYQAVFDMDLKESVHICS